MVQLIVNHLTKEISCRILGYHAGGYEEFYILECRAMYCVVYSVAVTHKNYNIHHGIMPVGCIFRSLHLVIIDCFSTFQLSTDNLLSQVVYLRKVYEPDYRMH
jgi:hypothetical protein